MQTKIIRGIRIDADKCTGCRSCEAICAAFHNGLALTNRERSRIRVFVDEENDIYIPVLAGPHGKFGCSGRSKIVINAKEYPECLFCRTSCPNRDLFKEPDSKNPLKCDMCGEPPLPEPLCVKWCQSDALTYVERKEEIETDDNELDEIGSAVKMLAAKYGLAEVQKALDKKQKRDLIRKKE